MVLHVGFARHKGVRLRGFLDYFLDRKRNSLMVLFFCANAKDSSIGNRLSVVSLYAQSPRLYQFFQRVGPSQFP